MTSGFLGSPVGNTIVPVVNLLKQTKQIALTVGTVTSNAGDVSSPSVKRAVAIFYQGTDLAWRMRFNVRVTFTAKTVTSVTVPVTGVLFSNASSGNNYQAVTCFLDTAAPIQNLAYPNTANLYCTLASTSVSAVTFSGDVELESEPTAYTTAANMENSQQIAAYIPSASASSAGLLSYYVESTWAPTVTLVGGAGNIVPVYTTNSARYTRIGNRVFCEIVLLGDGGAEGAGSGRVNIALPFTASASALEVYRPVGWAINNTTEYMIYGRINASSGTIFLTYISSVSALGNFTGDQQNNTTREIRLAFFYET